MNDIIIKNGDLVLEASESVLTNSLHMKSVCESIDFIIQELGNYWSETEDKQSFSNELRHKNDDLNEIINCNQNFAKSLEEYINTLSNEGGKIIR